MDLTNLAIPAYFGTMALEHRRLARRAATDGTTAADYVAPDTRTSLAMGVGSLVAPAVTAGLVKGLSAHRWRWGRRLLAATAAAAVATAVADRVARRATERTGSGDGADNAPVAIAGRQEGARVERARQVARIGGAATMAGAGVLATVGWAHVTSPSRLWRRRRRDLGQGPAVWAGAVVGWDFIYYWNHRFMHEVRALWAHHVVHHSSERYNLSTALRQPVSPFGVFVPYGLMAWAGVRPSLIEQARGINLLYQYWIHTDVIRTLGAGEEVLNTPSHHRVHHASNRRYIDRNHGSILIVWDRLFGTFTREDPDEPVVYGLTRNIRTYNPLTVVGHEYVDMLRDVADSTTWRDRASFVLRGPGWAYRRRAELTGAAAEQDARPSVEPAPLLAAGR
jgi:sterol desaturase/sphingolipid hydroxylase (fatty acid hydroxylase superfamily)